MTGLMIVTLLVAVVSCGAVFVLVDMLATGIMKRMKKEVFRHIKQYNQLLDGEVADSRKQVADVKQENVCYVKDENLAVPFLPSVRPMRKADFFSDYRKIREVFCHRPEEIVKEIQHTQERENVSQYVMSGSILEKLSFEVLYMISEVSSEKQLAILEEILDEREREVLSAYRESTTRPFDCTEFHMYVKNLRLACDDTVYCFVAPGQSGQSEQLSQCKLIEEESLCEGFQLLHKNLLYDYGLRKSEIG